jgi:hypothetical protein
MTVTVATATLLELAELGGAKTRQDWADVRALAAAGHLYAFHAVSPGSSPGQPPREELICLGGFMPIAGVDGAANMVLNAAPGLARHALGFLRAARLTLATEPYRPILTVCVSAAGRAFARRLGFSFRTATDFGEVWVYGGHSEQPVRGEQGAAAGAAGAGGPDRGEPADEPGADRGGTGPA